MLYQPIDSSELSLTSPTAALSHIKPGVRMKSAAADYWACIRDQEEVVGIFSTNPTVVKHFSYQISSFTSQGVDIEP